MKNIFFLHEIITYNFRVEILTILSFLIITLGILVIVRKNPIVSILFLIGLFGSVSVYLILIGLEFIGLAYLMIYVGAVSILFLFILMLISVRISELQNNNNNSLLLAILISILFNYDMLYNLYHNEDPFVFNNDNSIYLANSNDWSGNLIDTNHIANIGTILYTNYNIWIILTSFILLLAMVGSIVITLKQR